MVLHQHQGRIWAESDSAGAVFSFVLPLQPGGGGLSAGTRGSEGAWVAKLAEN
jgi:hypothetical protein